MKIVIAGGAGTLGRRIAADLEGKGYEIAVLTRSPRDGFPHRQVRWDGRTAAGWTAQLEDAVVINLAGELVDRRPTRKNIELLTRSRVEPTRALVGASKGCRKPPRLWLQASSTAIYGDSGDAIVDEDFPIPPGPPQMPGVALPWENAARDASTRRQVIFRSSLVLDTDTPVLDRLTRLVKCGLGGRISHGRQWVSWIHIQDFLRALCFLIEGDLVGVVNVTSPNPVQNDVLMAELRRHLNRRWSPPAPAPLVRVGALAIGSDPALALTGRRCTPRRLLGAGFTSSSPSYRPRWMIFLELRHDVSRTHMAACANPSATESWMPAHGRLERCFGPHLTRSRRGCDPWVGTRPGPRPRRCR